MYGLYGFEPSQRDLSNDTTTFLTLVIPDLKVVDRAHKALHCITAET